MARDIIPRPDETGEDWRSATGCLRDLADDNAMLTACREIPCFLAASDAVIVPETTSRAASSDLDWFSRTGRSKLAVFLDLILSTA